MFGVRLFFGCFQYGYDRQGKSIINIISEIGTKTEHVGEFLRIVYSSYFVSLSFALRHFTKLIRIDTSLLLSPSISNTAPCSIPKR